MDDYDVTFIKLEENYTGIGVDMGTRNEFFVVMDNFTGFFNATLACRKYFLNSDALEMIAYIEAFAEDDKRATYTIPEGSSDYSGVYVSGKTMVDMGTWTSGDMFSKCWTAVRAGLKKRRRDKSFFRKYLCF